MARQKQTKRKRTPQQAHSRRMLVRQLLIGFVLVLVLAGIIVGIWHLTRLPQLTITSVSAAGGVTIDTAAVEATVEQQLVGSYYRLVPRRFSYTYPKDSIIAAVQSIPRVKEVTVERENRTALAVTFSEYEPIALWCGDNEAMCVFVDQAGYGFATTPRLRGGSFIRYENAERAPEIGVVGVPSAVLERTQRFAVLAGEVLSVRVHRVWFSDRDIIYTLGGGGEIRTNREDDIATVITNTETILTSDEFAHLEPGNFEYIDLRYGNKVFVQEVIEEVATSTASTTE